MTEKYAVVEIKTPNANHYVERAVLKRMPSGLILVTGTKIDIYRLEWYTLMGRPIPDNWPIESWREPTWWEKYIERNREPIPVYERTMVRKSPFSMAFDSNAITARPYKTTVTLRKPEAMNDASE